MKQPEKLKRPAAKAKAAKNDSTATIGFEARLWLAARQNSGYTLYA